MGAVRKLIDRFPKRSTECFNYSEVSLIRLPKTVTTPMENKYDSKLKVTNHVPTLISSHISVTVNSVCVNTKKDERTGKNRKKHDTILLTKQISTPRYVLNIYFSRKILTPTHFIFK